MPLLGDQAVTVIEDRKGVAALLSPLRREILERLHGEPDSATGLGRKLGLARQKINYHVRTLEQAKLIELVGQEKRRGCWERRFRPTARAYLISPDLAGNLGADPASIRDRFSSAYLVTLGARLIRDLARLRRGAEKAGKRLATFALEVDIRFRSAADRSAFAEELAGTVAQLVSRYQDDSPTGRPFRFVIGGHPVARDPDAGSQAEVHNAQKGV